VTSAKVNKIIERLKFGEKVEKELNHTFGVAINISSL